MLDFDGRFINNIKKINGSQECKIPGLLGRNHQLDLSHMVEFNEIEIAEARSLSHGTCEI